MTTEENNFLARWSRRKIEAKEKPDAAQERLKVEEEVAAHPPSVEAPVSAQTEEAASDTEHPDLSEFDDIDFDSLDYDADYTRFMGKGVPEAIQRRALRALWNSDPVFANLDGLNDYDEDFTDAALAVKALQSAYQVGRGYLTGEDEEAPEGVTPKVAEADSGQESDGGVAEHGDNGDIAASPASDDDPETS